MRIIGGKYRNRRLAGVRGDIRPTSDRLREALFAVLADSVSDSVWLDAFAGSGAVGIEALSRGARYVVFNDNRPKAVGLLRKNLALCKLEEGYEIHPRDVFVFLRHLNSPPLDFVFLDPPYRFDRYARLLNGISKVSSLQDSTVIILEVFKKTSIDFVPESLTVSRTLRVGDAQLVFITVKPEHLIS